MEPLVRTIRYKKRMGADETVYDIRLSVGRDGILHVNFVKVRSFEDDDEIANPFIANTVNDVLQKNLGYAINEPLMDSIKEDVSIALETLFMTDSQFKGYELIRR